MTGPARVQSGQSFEVSVVANQVGEPGLFGVQFELLFDPALVQVETLRLHPDLRPVAEQTIQNDTGRISVVASGQGQTLPLTGNLTLATFILTAQAEGQLELRLSQVIAGARDGARLELPVRPDWSLRISNN